MSRSSSVLIVVALLVSTPAGASPRTVDRHSHIQSLDRMMAALATESARDALAIRTIYQDYFDALFLSGYADLEVALATGGLAPLPADPLRFNLMPRLDGLHPIGEKDLDNQASYVAARTSTLGALFEIASRVRSGSLEITSLVRHGDYQDALRQTNLNANASVPIHAMGLAVDIALINSPLETVYEIRDVLREMRDDGDLLFIGERQQLVFHVVPNPARLGHFMEVYAAAMTAAGETGAHVVTSMPVRIPAHSHLVPTVTAEITSIVPVDPALEGEWWAEFDQADLVVTVIPPEPASPDPLELSASAGARSFLSVLEALFTAALRIVSVV